jgi:hypothetical protein
VVAKPVLDRNHSVGKEGYYNQRLAVEGKKVGLDTDMDTAVHLEVVVVRMVPHLAVEEGGGSFKLSVLSLEAEERMNGLRVRFI